MNNDICFREDELLDALQRGFIGQELEQHVRTCTACSELHTVAGALLDDKSTAVAAATLPAAGTMWWRMRVRHRHDAETTARRSLLIGQALTLTVSLTLVVLFFGVDIAAAVRQVIDSVRVSTPVLVAIAMWLLAAPIAGWVAIRQK